MAKTVAGRFGSRRDAELAVEHLVQEHGIERADVFVQSATADNTAGTAKAGADAESGHPGVPKDGAPALHGQIEVSVDIDDGQAAIVAQSLKDAGATAVATR